MTYQRRYELSGCAYMLTSLRPQCSVAERHGVEAALWEEELEEAQQWLGSFGGGTWPHSELFDFDGWRCGQGQKRHQGGWARSHHQIRLHHREWSECQRDATESSMRIDNTCACSICT
jgi:hypothetical protein